MTEIATDKAPPVLTGRKLLVLGGCLLGATVVIGLACSLLGQAELTSLVWSLRLTRLASAALVGAALAAGGMALQAMFRNPLAEPYLLGISSGAGVGVLLGMSMAGAILPSWFGEPALAFAGAMLTCGVVYLIAQRRGRLDSYSLILSGVIVNVFNGAVMLAIHLYVDPYRIAVFSRWMMGEIPETTSTGVLLVCAVCILAGWAVLFLRSAGYNALGLGEEVACSSGVPVGRLRIETFVCVSLMAGAAVALAGPVGFLGLIVPHICRMILRADFRVLIIAGGFAGAIFLMVVETACYCLGPFVDVAAIPVGIVTALCGGPFFLVLLRRQLRGAGA
ncbi:MAG: iron ABC transporter permease [Phycisphaerae bacterium]|nr:iron ABC transporter permease [Phycisphaerae bacterium]